MQNLSIKTKKRKVSNFVKIIVIPITIIALIFLSIGIYSFIGANYLMRIDPKKSDEFPSNILPPFSNAYFTSLDGQTSLEGWFFRTKLEPISTVIMIHGNNNDRLQFGKDTIDLYSFFLQKGFNVLSFDLRHSGESNGHISTFGYNEWQDVIGAISYVRKTSSTTNVLLYGIGSGTAAGLIAMDHLPKADEPKDDYPYNIGLLEYDRSYIIGLILDLPLVTPDDYIDWESSEKLFLGDVLGRHVVPYAIRLSSGIEKKYNLAVILSESDIPVHIIYGNYNNDRINKSAKITSSERFKIFPNDTSEYIIGKDNTEIITATDEFYDKDEYINSIDKFFSDFIIPNPR